MGYILAARTVDPDVLRSAIGGRDTSLCDRVIRKFPDDFDDDEYPEGYTGVTMRQALADLIMTGDDSRYTDVDYANAFIALADTIGKLHFADRWPADEIEAHTLFDRDFPFLVPSQGNFPRLCYIACAQVPNEKNRLDDIHAHGPSGLVDLWIQCLDYATHHQHDIVLSYG